MASQGRDNKDIAQEVGVGRVAVARWRQRYLDAGLEGIERDLPRGAPPVKVDVGKLVELTTQTTPQAATHWSTRKMAAQIGVSPSTVMRHWQAHGLKPHLVRGFKVSRDPEFVEKLEDIVGLYMSPPEHALVLCCDEKSQVCFAHQALGLRAVPSSATLRQRFDAFGCEWSELADGLNRAILGLHINGAPIDFGALDSCRWIATPS